MSYICSRKCRFVAPLPCVRAGRKHLAGGGTCSAFRPACILTDPPVPTGRPCESQIHDVYVRYERISEEPGHHFPPRPHQLPAAHQQGGVNKGPGTKIGRNILLLGGLITSSLGLHGRCNSIVELSGQGKDEEGVQQCWNGFMRWQKCSGKCRFGDLPLMSAGLFYTSRNRSYA